MNFPAREDVTHLIEDRPLPTFTRVTYEPPSDTLETPVASVRDQLDRFDVSALDPGETVAIGVGSRGIHQIAAVTTAVVEWTKRRGLKPVIVPAMGSHGGATADGQRDVLHSLGIGEAGLGAPIDARMDTTQVATVTVGGRDMPVFVSKTALAADGVIVINRVKPHTNFTGPIESGLAKMTVVGLGKQRGANAFHSTAIDAGYVETLKAAYSVIESAVSLLGGVALVENAEKALTHVEAVPAGSILDREPALLSRAYDELATLPVDDLDLLIVDTIGKEVSGTGMDTNVIGRYRVRNASDPETPSIDLIYVRGLTAATDGNGNGIGLADITRQAAVDDLDLEKTYANALTSGSLAKSKLPLVAPDDEVALQTACAALGGYDPETARVLWIKNTESLREFFASSALVADLPDVATVGARGVTIAFENGEATLSLE